MSSLPQPAHATQIESDPRRLSEPAWLVDLNEGRVLAASAAGRSLLQGALAEGTVLDAAMPALRLLREVSARPEGLEPRQLRLRLWTSRGLAELRCLCRPGRPGSGEILVIATGLGTARPAETCETGRAGAVRPWPAAYDRDRATLAHELRTPLGAIMALAEVMRDERLGPLGSERYRVYASDIHDSARHALGVVGAMLEGEAQGEEAQETVVDEVVLRCLSVMQGLAERAMVRLEADLAPGRPRLAVGQRSLMQILLNLVSNALRFTPVSGTVRIITCPVAGGGLEVAVVDTGAGMLQADIDRVLASAGQPRGPEQSGYGLPLVKAMAEKSGARLEITSAQGRGTRVSLRYPASCLLGRPDLG